MTTRRDAQWFTLLAAAIVCAVAACSGFDRGWARGRNDDYRPGGDWAPGFDLKLQLGWWNYTSTLELGKQLPQIRLQDTADRSLGTVACVVIGLSGLFAIHLLATSLCENAYPRALKVDAKTQHILAAVFAVAVAAVSLGLYLTLAIGVNTKLKDQFGRGLWCRPDWAFVFAILSAVCWAILARTSPSHAADAEGYLPI